MIRIAQQPAQEIETMLQEMQELVEVECDDDDVLRVTGMTKEELLRTLKEDVGMKDMDLSDDLRGKLERLFSEGDSEGEREAVDVDRTLDGLMHERQMSVKERDGEQQSILTEAGAQRLHVLQVAEQASAKEYRLVEEVEQGSEQQQIAAVRKALGKQNPGSDN